MSFSTQPLNLKDLMAGEAEFTEQLKINIIYLNLVSISL